MSDLKSNVIAQRWVTLIKERTDSGMTIKEWCQGRNIKDSQYDYWLKTLRKEEAGSRELEQPAAPFVELPVVCREQQAPLQGGTAAIIRKGDISIEVFSLNPFQKDILFLFCGRRTDRIKGLWTMTQPVLFWMTCSMVSESARTLSENQ